MDSALPNVGVGPRPSMAAQAYYDEEEREWRISVVGVAGSHSVNLEEAAHWAVALASAVSDGMRMKQHHGR